MMIMINDGKTHKPEGNADKTFKFNWVLKLKWFVSRVGLPPLPPSPSPRNSSCLGLVGVGRRYLLAQPTSDDTRFKTEGSAWSVKTESPSNFPEWLDRKEVKQRSLLLQDFSFQLVLDWKAVGNPGWGLHSALNGPGDKATETPGNLLLLRPLT